MVVLLLVLATLVFLVSFFVRWIVNLERKSLMHYGLLSAVLLSAWWFFGLVYTLGHTVFSDLLTQPVYSALSHVIAGPFLLLSEHLLSPHTHIVLHILLVAALGFGSGVALGLLKKCAVP